MASLVSRGGHGLIAAVLLAGCGGDDTARVWRRTSPQTGIVSGLVLDGDTGTPVADAEVEVSSGQRVRTRVDGSFEVTAPAGRARVSVRRQGYLLSAREVAVGQAALPTPFRLARRAEPVSIGPAGGIVRAQLASVEIPAGAYRQGASLSVTYLPRARVAAVPAPPQFVDDNQAPRRVVGAVALEGTEPPAAPVRLRVPVPADASGEDLVAYTVDPDGRWTNPVRPEAVSEGMAIFPVRADGSYGIAVDSRRADLRRVGYFVLDPGDGVVPEGDVLTGGAEVAPGRRAMAVVDPQGTRVEVGVASRVRFEAPEQMASDGRAVPYAGRAQVMAGQARFVVARPRVAEAGAVRLSVRTPTAAFEATGTAFTLTTCPAAGRTVDVLEVVEGKVDVMLGGDRQTVTSGETVTLCLGCRRGEAPTCSPPDAGAGPDGPLVARDAASADGVARDAAASPDLAPSQRDAERPMDVALPRDVAPPDAAAPDTQRPVDTAPPPVDAPPPPPDMAPPEDAALPVDAPPADAGMAALTVSPAARDFGAVTIGTSSASYRFIVSNGGSAPTGPISVALGGADPVHFAISANDCVSPLAAGASCAVDVRFAPVATGSRSASLAIGGGAGVGTSAMLLGTGVAAAALAIQPVAKDYGSVLVGSSSAAQAFTIGNTGGAGTGALSVSLVGASAVHFTLVSNRCTGAMLAPGGTCAVEVAFSPTAAGSRSVTLAVSANPGGSASASLTGTGVTGATLEILPAKQDYGEVVVGTASGEASFTVRNVGGTATGQPSVRLTGGHASEFHITSDGCSAAIGPGDSCPVKVKFGPASTGVKAAVLEVSAQPGGTVSADLAGRGIPALSISPSAQDFGETKVGQPSQTYTFMVTNAGAQTTGQLSIFLGGTNDSEFSIVTNGCVNPLPPMTSCMLQLRFSPRAVGVRTATLNVMASPGGSATSSLSGTGIQ